MTPPEIQKALEEYSAFEKRVKQIAQEMTDDPNYREEIERIMKNVMAQLKQRGVAKR